MTGQVRPDEHDDPVAAVLAARREGALLALPTSGTTGLPVRRVVRTTGSWWDSFGAYSELTGVGASARVWVPGPLASTMNLFAAVHAVETGAHLVEDPAHATHACLTPTQLERRGGELSRGTAVVVAGAHLPGGLLLAARDAGLRVSHYYGAAELSFVAAAKEGDELRPFAQVEIEVRDCPVPGTIWVRSPWVCERLTGAAGSLLLDVPGWASVGDLGQFTAGLLTVRGRPDAIVTAGATVLIADVEAVLSRVAAGGVAVHGVAHPTLGHVVAVTLTNEADREPLERLAREQLPVTHRPRVWHVVESLPTTAAAKVDRAALGRGPS
jgi:acyl-CoA synthetase (AMP-forming)/AMP-acid ligase II